MLKKLAITNYALIAHTELELSHGYTVITGETGSGKSIMLEALALVLGSRANFNGIRKGEDKCIVEATFTSQKSILKAIIEREGLDWWNEIVLRRELTSAGRSRAFVNDSPVTMAVLKEIADYLVDMHGQQESFALHKTAFQTRQLDLFTGNQNLVDQYINAYSNYKSLLHRKAELEEQAVKIRKDEDYFRFQLDELATIDLDNEVYKALEVELNELEHTEEIQRAIVSAKLSIADSESNALSAIRHAINDLKAVRKYSSDLAELHDRLQSASIELEDVNSELERRDGAVEFNQNRLDNLRDRLDLYSKLFHKHNVSSIENLAIVKSEYTEKLKGIESIDENLTEIELELIQQHNNALELANSITEKRLQAISSFESELLKQVHQLGMPKAHFKIELSRNTALNSNGNSEVKMLFNANTAADLQPITEVASGGEISRLMLGLKSILSQVNDAPTMIFDEIDTGVSGEVAKRIGNLMRLISRNTQIIAVTHLPGVAAKAQTHFKIVKSETDSKPVSALSLLNEDERIKELATMFTGDKLTQASLESARLLLKEQ